MDELRQRVLWEQGIAQRRMRKLHDEKIKPTELQEGDLVLWYPGKLNKRKKALGIIWTGPYEL